MTCRLVTDNGYPNRRHCQRPSAIEGRAKCCLNSLADQLLVKMPRAVSAL